MLSRNTVTVIVNKQILFSRTGKLSSTYSGAFGTDLINLFKFLADTTLPTLARDFEFEKFMSQQKFVQFIDVQDPLWYKDARTKTGNRDTMLYNSTDKQVFFLSNWADSAADYLCEWKHEFNLDTRKLTVFSISEGGHAIAKIVEVVELDTMPSFLINNQWVLRQG